jgi:hypothetical protein
MKETIIELTPAKYKPEQPNVPKRIMLRKDLRIKTSLMLSSILNDSLGRAFDDYVKCIDYSIYENGQQRDANDWRFQNAC